LKAVEATGGAEGSADLRRYSPDRGFEHVREQLLERAPQHSLAHPGLFIVEQCVPRLLAVTEYVCRGPF
jgi:hypothetical protein